MGGTGAIARALTRLCNELGIEVHTNSAVEHIEVQNGRATAVVANGVRYAQDAIVANSDIVRTFSDLLPKSEGEPYLRKNSARLEPACSGVVLYQIGRAHV